MIAGFDLSEEPPPDLHTIKLETEPSEKAISFYTGTIVSVIHLELDKEIELFKCYECISLHQEVLLISVHRACLWWTENAERLVFVSRPFFHKQQASPRAQFNFGNYHRLQQLSADDVMFIFCGNVIGTGPQPSKCCKRSRNAMQAWMIWMTIGCMQRVYRYWKRRMLIRKRYGHDPMKQIENFHSGRKAKVRRICQSG